MGSLRSLTSLAVWALICIAARSGVDSLALPEGWTAHVDEKSGKQYYANRATGATSWQPPPGSKPDEAATAASTSAQPAVNPTSGEVSEAADVLYVSEGADAGWALVDSFAALRKACAVNNARVIITADLVFDNHILISGKKVTIKGAAGSSRLRTHESDATNFFKVTNNAELTVSDLYFVGGKSDHGGAISVESHSSLVAVRVEFHNCFAKIDGGAVRVKMSSVSLTHVVIGDCVSEWYGGAVSGTESSTVVLTHVKILRSNAAHDGESGDVSPPNRPTVPPPRFTPPPNSHHPGRRCTLHGWPFGHK